MSTLAVPLYGGSNETQVYTYLTGTMGLNKAAALGILANIYKESGFNPKALGDNGTSYGLCQWHDTSTGVGRWTNLRRYCGNNGLNPTTVSGQMSYLNYELTSGSYSTLLGILRSVPNTSQGCWEAAAQWCARFEVPSGYGSWNNGVLTLGTTSKARGDFARDTFWSAYSGVSTKTTPTVNKGNLIIAEAKKHFGDPYVWGAESPGGFDCSGFVYYVYKTAINYNWYRKTAYLQWKDHGRTVSSLRAGDLIFFEDTYETGCVPNISHVGIATGNGNEFIHCGGGKGVSLASLDDSYYKSHFHSAKRLVSDSETSVGTGLTVTGEASTSMTFAVMNTYEEEMGEALEYIDEQNIGNYNNTGYKYGYLVDLKNGGEFKFFVPEYDVGITTNWDDVNILGRSATIKGYNSTSSRSVNITLTLIAGSGLYEKGRGRSRDRVADLHDDIAFVQSLAYPDYSKAIALPPPVVLLYLGPTLKMKGVVSDVKVNYMKPYDINMRPMRVDLSFTVNHITDNPPDYYDVRNHSFEGAQTSIITNYTAVQENSEDPYSVVKPSIVKPRTNLSGVERLAY